MAGPQHVGGQRVAGTNRKPVPPNTAAHSNTRQPRGYAVKDDWMPSLPTSKSMRRSSFTILVRYRGTQQAHLQDAAGVDDEGRAAPLHSRSNFTGVADIAADHGNVRRTAVLSCASHAARPRGLGACPLEGGQGRRRSGAAAAAEEDQLFGAALSKPSRHQQAQPTQSAADEGGLCHWVAADAPGAAHICSSDPMRNRLLCRPTLP